jgi:hypothetical protein
MVHFNIGEAALPPLGCTAHPHECRKSYSIVVINYGSMAIGDQSITNILSLTSIGTYGTDSNSYTHQIHEFNMRFMISLRDNNKRMLWNYKLTQ